MLWNKLFKEQKQGVRFVLERPGSCLFFDQGTGKTYVTLAVIEQEMNEPGYQALLIVLKTNKLTTWKTKIEELLPGINLAMDLPTLKKLSHPRLLLMHYEQFTAKLAQACARLPWSFVVFDESQRLKKRSSLSARNARKLRHAQRRCVLSGTPIDKTPIDLWSQLQFADMSIFGDNWPAFDKRFLRKTGFMGYERKFKPGMQEAFMRRAAKVCLRVDREFLNLPETRMHLIEFDLWGKQAKLYDELENDLVIEIGETGTVSTPLKVTLMGKLSQITGGFVIDDDGTSHRVGKAKQRALRSLLPKLEAPVVVFCRYRHEITEVENILREYYLAVRSLHGGVKDEDKRRDRSDLLEAFQRGEVDAMVCQVRTGGVGVDLFRSSSAVFYSTTYSHIDFEQAKSRLDRYGQRNEVDFFFLMAKNTIDEDQYQALQSKGQVNKVLFNRLKNLQPKESTVADEDKKVKAAPKDKVKAAPKDKVKAKAETKAPAEKPAAQPEFKYGVADVAADLGIAAASVRVALRNKGIKKAGKSYGWNTKAEKDEVVAKLKPAKAEAKAPAKSDKKKAA